MTYRRRYDTAFTDYHVSRSDDGAGLIIWAAGVIGIMLIVAICVLALIHMPASGPNCPGMDPAYLGWCDQP